MQILQGFPIALLFAVISTGANGAISTYSTNFDAFPGPQVAGYDGWFQMPPGEEPQLNFLVNPGGAPPGDLYAALGGGNAFPNFSDTIELSHSVDVPLSFAPSFSVDFFITNSTLGSDDNFGWKFRDTASGDLLTVKFTDSGINTQRRININGVTFPFDIATGSSYNLTVNFSSGGVDGVYSGSISGAGSFPFGGTIPGAGGASLGEFSALYVVNGLPLSGAGDNTMYFNNLAAVPEPSTSLVAGLGLLGFCLHRRRK